MTFECANWPSALRLYWTPSNAASSATSSGLPFSKVQLAGSFHSLRYSASTVGVSHWLSNETSVKPTLVRASGVKVASMRRKSLIKIGQAVVQCEKNINITCGRPSSEPSLIAFPASVVHLDSTWYNDLSVKVVGGRLRRQHARQIKLVSDACVIPM